MRINVGDKVRVDTSMGYLSNVMGETGEVVQVYDFLVPMAVVKFENGITAKVEISNLRKVEAQENVEPKSEIPEGAKKISRADFDNAVDHIVAPEKILFSGGNPMATIAKVGSVMALRDSVRNEIFKGNDNVVMTEDEFIAILWNACNPGVVSKLINSVKPGRKLNKIAVGAFISFEEVVEILFGEPEND